MAQILKQSIAVDVLIGPFLDLTDMAAAETGESPAVKLSKSGQALAAKNDVTTPVHDADGYYNCELDATDTSTVGTLVLTVAASANALPVRHDFQVVEEAIYDALYGASAGGFDANGQVDVGSWLGTAVPAPTTAGVPSVSLTSLGLDDIVSTATGMVEIAKAIWDRVLNGALHNLPGSAGRRLRIIQESGSYEGGAVWIDTVNGTAGTTDFESGVDILPINTVADMNIIAASVGLSRFAVAPGSLLTFVASQDDQVFVGHDWTLALGGQSISGSYFNGAAVSGIGTGVSAPMFDHCEIGTCTLGVAHFDDCDLENTITLSAAGTYFFDHCSHAGGIVVIDFGALVGNTTVHIHDYHGALTIKNMGQVGTDVLHFSSPDGKLTLDPTCIGGTVNLNGTFDLVNNGSGQALNQGGDAISIADAILADTETDGVIVAAASRTGYTLSAAGNRAVMTEQMIEGYAADGVMPTPEQALMGILQQAGEFAVAGTTITVKKLDGSTVAMTFTLDDATNPTSRTRVT